MNEGLRKFRPITQRKKEGEKSFKNATREELKQLVMLIETDGCISYKQSRGICYPCVEVTMCSLIPVGMCNLWGGTINKGLTEKGKIKYIWGVRERSLLRQCLGAITPYLTEKKNQAELALMMLDLLNSKPKDWKEKLKDLAAKMSKLNEAGPPDIDLDDL